MMNDHQPQHEPTGTELTNQIEASSEPKPRFAFLRRLALRITLVLTSILVATVASLYGMEWLCRKNDPQRKAFWYNYSEKPIAISYDELFFPTSSIRFGMLPANLHYKGKAPWENQNGNAPDFEIDMTTNDCGFLT